MAHEYLASEASTMAQKISASMTYGGATFSVFQWLSDNANWIAALVGIIVTIAGFVWNRIDAEIKKSQELRVRELEEFLMLKEEERKQEAHEARMESIKRGIVCYDEDI